MTSHDPSTRFPLAVVGIGCRLPGNVSDVEGFWSLLSGGKSGIREVPENRWNRDRFYHPDAAVPGTMHTKWGGFVDNLDRFDAPFWGISPRESVRMDPQQRWLLEVAWEAIEDSGTPPATLRGENIGVFVGIAGNDYGGLQVPYHEIVDAYTNSGCTLSIASNRISYLFDLRGPSLSIDTACSSALVALWTACESIWAGSCVAALSGGVNSLITPHASIGFSKASMLSRTGQCFAFDSRANGYVRGEGAGMVYVKPLSRAVADRDRIYAVIRSAFVNQDGHTSSMTVPGVDGQTAMLRQAYARMGLTPGRVVYMEAHGTGTPVGDPIEFTALSRVLGDGRPPGQKCLLGSVKTNIGHLEAGSGIAGLIKASLILERQAVPPSLNFEKPNPHIPFDTAPLAVATQLQPLPRQGVNPPLVAVNSFGFGGTNAHVVLEEPPRASARQAESRRAERPHLLPISARDEEALRRYARSYRALIADSSHPLADIAYSAGARKEHHDRRVVAIGRNSSQIVRRLDVWLQTGGRVTGIVSGRSAAVGAPLVFAFTGQGAQWWAMGRQLLAREPIFHETVSELDALFRPLAGWSLLESMNCREEESRIDRTDVAQPAIFALQVGLCRLWESWGIRADKVIGHSVGEVAAAYWAGIYSPEDAVHIIYHRSRLQHETGGNGRMVVAGVTQQEALEAIGSEIDRVQVAVINSAHLVTLAGDAEPVERIEAQLKQAGRFVRQLRIAYAFHTHQMDPIRQPLLEALADIRPRAARIPFISTVTGREVSGDLMGADYWWRNVRQPVLFGPAVSRFLEVGEHAFIELGPHPALESSIKECQGEQGRVGPVFHSLRRGTDESLEILTELAGLHNYGVPLDWAAINQSGGNYVPLPHYPWSYEPYWLETKDSVRTRLTPFDHPLLGLRQAAILPTWQGPLDARRLPFLLDHSFWDSLVFPAAGYCEIGLAIAAVLFPDESYAVDELEIHKALFFGPAESVTLQVGYDPEDHSFSVHSRHEGKDEWDLNACARLTRSARDAEPLPGLPGNSWVASDRIAHEEVYAELDKAGYQFGPAFRQIRNLWRSRGTAVAEITAPDAVAADLSRFQIHPALLDACFQATTGVRPHTQGPGESNLYLPQAIRQVRLCQTPVPSHLWAQARLVREDEATTVADIRICDDEGRTVAEVKGFETRRVERGTTSALTDPCYYQFHWEPRRLRGCPPEGTCLFPPVHEIAAAGRTLAAELYERNSLEAYHRSYRSRTHQIALEAVENALCQLGWRPRAGDCFTTEALRSELGIVPAHERLFESQLRTLQQAGLLGTRADGEWEVLRQPVILDHTQAFAQLSADFPQLSADIALLTRSVPHLATVLAGEVDPIDLLFPGGSSRLLEEFYVGAGEFRSFYELIPAALRHALANLPPGRVIRVLEVGGGTGSLTRAVLPVFPPERTDYTFTDIGPTFLASAKKQFADYGFVEYRTFDLEQSPESQGLEPGSYDLIVATDVIHATADVRQSLAHLARCLASDGLLLFLEAISDHPVGENIFGLLKGWWKFADTDLRPHSPLLNRTQWQGVLAEAGFRDVQSFTVTPDDREQDHVAFVARPPLATREGGTSPCAIVAPRFFLVLADTGGVADVLMARLRPLGHRVWQVRPGSEYSSDGSGAFSIPPSADEGDWLRLAAELPADASVEWVDCWSLDRPDAEGSDLEALGGAQQSGVLHAFQMLRSLGAAPAKMWFAVRDVYAVLAQDRCEGLASAPLVGMLRVANNEFYPARLAIVDLGSVGPEQQACQLAEELLYADDEREIAYRDGTRYGLRLGRSVLDQLPPRTRDAVRPDGSCVPYRLQTTKPGILTNLGLFETERDAPGPTEVEIRVRAGGINFRDVMKALGTYPGSPVDLLWFGDDFAGIVERVGDRVVGLRPGDRVAGMAPCSFRAYARVPERLVFKIPPSLSFEQAATLPTAFLTAHYALEHLARMEAGESILIHGGSGGVGQAAIQIAQHRGLTVFATAGTPEKRELLTRLGVPHVLNSRSLEFAEEILDRTQGRGVDAVLNSFAGDFIPKSFAVLAPFGRFLEIGKVDVYRNSKIGMRRLKDNISYHVIDLAQHLLHKPAWVARLFAEIGERIGEGTYRPLPYTAYPVTEAAEAFRNMAQGKHIGKNVLSFDLPSVPVRPCLDEPHWFRRDGTYLITGGAGGFCFEVAKWMARHGAGHLVLMSRSGPQGVGVLEEMARLRRERVMVVDARGDVRCLEDVRRVLRQIRDDFPPLKGIVHGAMVLDDEFLIELDEPRFRRALEPKMAGAWNLHRETLDAELDHFVCFSSYSATVGALKQANYNAGNYFLDALVHYRRARGLPGLAVDWGAIRGAGFVERNQKTAEYLDKVGVKAFQVDEALQILGRLMQWEAGQITVCRTDWRQFAGYSPVVGSSPTFAQLARESQGADHGGSLLARLTAANPEGRPALVEEFIAAQVASVFGVSGTNIDRDTPLTRMGLDSLMAIELKNRIEHEAGITLPMTELMHGPTLSQLAQVVLKQVGDPSGSAPAETPATTSISASAPQEQEVESKQAEELLERIDDLSEQEIDVLLAQMDSLGPQSNAETPLS